MVLFIIMKSGWNLGSFEFSQAGLLCGDRNTTDYELCLWGLLGWNGWHWHVLALPSHSGNGSGRGR